ncbi:hypothetical protein HZP82_04555 [Elizabethkingia anophelis]|nr:hypothetical protein [Elizabethkingia anophelis]MCT4104527.1 hypothetical protein [Elizabethkingia anophelis]
MELDFKTKQSLCRTKIMYYIADNNISINRTAIKRLESKIDELTEYSGFDRGTVQLSLMDLMPPRSVDTIKRAISKVENKRLEFYKKPRSSSGAYKRDMSNYSHKLMLLKRELELAQSEELINKVKDNGK